YPHPANLLGHAQMFGCHRFFAGPLPLSAPLRGGGGGPGAAAPGGGGGGGGPGGAARGGWGGSLGCSGRGARPTSPRPSPPPRAERGISRPSVGNCSPAYWAFVQNRGSRWTLLCNP